MKWKIDRHLHDGEKAEYIGIPSWFKYRHKLMLSPLVIPLFLAGLKKYSTHLVITDNRVLTRQGILGDRSKSVRFDNMTTVKVHQTAMGRILNYGNLHIHTQTGGHADLEFHFIKNPVDVKKHIEKRMR
tara:strand:+ start:2661 stop:3047 length:387 start_codon:yes stop_codon:yes gene_type:complete